MIYLGSSKDLWLTFGGKRRNVLKGFCNADWAGQKHRHSISGYLFHMGQEVVTWSSKKQHIVAFSSTEAEYIGQMHVAKEAIYLCNFISKIQGELYAPLTINCDNQGVIALSKDNKFHAWTKHIDIWFHFIQEAVEDGKISVNYVPTDENLADIFTKLLVKVKFKHFCEMLGLRTIDKLHH